jgi:hypothetical protein
MPNPAHGSFLLVIFDQVTHAWVTHYSLVAIPPLRPRQVPSPRTTNLTTTSLCALRSGLWSYATGCFRCTQIQIARVVLLSEPPVKPEQAVRALAAKTAVATQRGITR